MRNHKKKFSFLVVLALLISLFTPLGFNAQVSQAAADQAAAAADSGRVLLASAYPAWDSGKVYLAGDIVSYNGQDYKAKWWTPRRHPRCIGGVGADYPIGWHLSGMEQQYGLCWRKYRFLQRSTVQS
ncbi:hypothetical protein HMSSN036_06390 [Paenibacillus macerans]|nr:hypothetical protein HMSSN036_06390 [Paenibacillus macerans]